MTSQRLASIFVPLCLMVVLTAVKCVEGEDDLYHVLGVSNSASSREIRSAYKRLAKKWHPDKNSLPEAKEKFIEINRAYEVLSDEDKRHTYDMTGEVGDSPQPRGHPHGNSFTVFTTGNGFQFRFFTGGPTHRGDGISADTFFNNILPNSHHKPYLINFYTDFCMQCGHVEQLWNDMRKEMIAMGVGLGSIHANHHPRVTTHCSVNEVPTVVGVVSGRVIHFHGNLRGIDTMQDFVNNILPQKVVLSISDVDAAESFLSQVISRNRPRVILFSPHRNPSVRYRLAAFAHQQSADCAFVSTHQTWLNRQLLSRFKVQPGAKELLVFKEDSILEPALHLEGFQLKGDMLRSAIGGLKLHLPRLSSQEMFDRVCSADGGNRLCVVLLVKESSSYNDTVTRAFRELSASTHSEEISFSYLDVEKQEEFVKVFGKVSSHLGSCEEGSIARPIIILKRLSSQQIRFDWYDQFCGAAMDSETLLTALNHLHGQLKRTAFTPHLLDEEAPGWFGRQLNRISQFYYDMMDFISVFDPQMLMSIGVLFVGTMLVCCLGLITGGPSDEEQKRSHHARHHTSGHRQRTPPPQEGSPQQKRSPVHYLNANSYVQLVQGAPKGQLSVVLLINTHDSTHSRPLAQSFWRIMEDYASSHVKVCFLCYRAYPEILGSILSRCEGMSDEERGTRVKMTLSGRCATVLAIIGSKKQLSIFPDMLNSCHRNGALVGGANGRARRSVGEVLGNSLGFDDDNEVNREQSPNRAHLSDDKIDSSNTAENNGQIEGAPTNKDAAAASSPSRADGCDPRVEQIKQLGMWMERFFDGSLKRYRVQDWPDWHTASQ